MSSPAPQYGEVAPPDVCYRHPNRATRVHCQRCDRAICPECQRPAAVGVQCPECVKGGAAQVNRGRAPAIVRAFMPGRSGVPIVTYSLIAACVIAYAIQWISGQALTDAWQMDPSRVRSEPWRLITSEFLHSPGFIFHILLNMYALFAFGPALESFLGRVRFLALYLIGGLGAGVANVLLYQAAVLSDGASADALGGFFAPHLAVGASGSIFALIGALVVLRRPMGLDLRPLLFLVVINFAITIFAPGIAWEGHVGGFLIGAAIAAVYSRTRRAHQVRTQILGVVGIAVGLAILVLVCLGVSPFAYV